MTVIAMMLFTLIGGASNTAAAASFVYYKYPWSDTIYKNTAGSTWTVALTYSQWVAERTPTPITRCTIPGDRTVRNLSHPEELFVDSPQGQADHHLSPAEWSCRGGVIYTTGLSYWKYSGDATIYQTPGNYKLDRDSWERLGFPTPLVK